MNIQDKANELYPVKNVIQQGVYFDENEDSREAYIKGREDEQSHLAGSKEEAEEVLDASIKEQTGKETTFNDLWMLFNPSPAKRYILKAMKGYAAIQVAKVHCEMAAWRDKKNQEFESLQQQLKEEKEKHEVYGNSTVNAMDTIEELQQQLSEKDKEINTLKIVATTLSDNLNETESENQRLTAEGEKLNFEIKALYLKKP